LGSPYGNFNLKTQGNRVLIFGPSDSGHGDIGAAKKKIDEIARIGNFTIELSIPHATALGDPAAKIAQLGYAQFTVTDAGPGRVRIVSDSIPLCEDWRRFLDDIRRLAWSPTPVPPVQKIFYLDANQVSGALNGTGGVNSVNSSTPAPQQPNQQQQNQQQPQSQQQATPNAGLAHPASDPR